MVAVCGGVYYSVRYSNCVFCAIIPVHSDAVIEILRREFPFAIVVGVGSENELESSLVNAVEAPLKLSTSVGGEQVDIEAGCLLRGAGERNSGSL